MKFSRQSEAPTRASSFLVRALCTSGFATLSLLAACSAAPDAATTSSGAAVSTTTAHTLRAPVQMNDVSILYPLASSAAEVASGYLTPASSGAKGALLPTATYTAVSKGIAPVSRPLTPSQAVPLANLRVVALRLDPCFAQAGPLESLDGCEPQIRLIFQPLDVVENTVNAEDMAVHVLYSLTADEFYDAVNDVIALREANGSGDLGPLAVHPLLAQQGMSGTMAAALNAIVLKYAGSTNLVRAAAFQRSAIGQFDSNWTLQAVDVTSGKTKAAPIPGVKETSQTISQPLQEPEQHTMKELLFDDPDTSDKIGDLLSVTSLTDSASVLQAAFDAASRIENPDVHTVNTIDCASCHTAAIATRFGQEKFNLVTDPSAAPFSVPDDAVSAADFAQTTPAEELLGESPQTATNIHAFSYNEIGPMIMQRTINETAAIVTFLNGHAAQAATATANDDAGAGAAATANDDAGASAAATANDDAGAATANDDADTDAGEADGG
jgi:hypothetical protein